MKKLGVLLIGSLLSFPVLAVDGVSVEYGNGDYTDAARVGLVWDWNKSWFGEGRDWHVTGFWEAAAGQWKGRSSVGNNQTVTDIGFTPVFRLEQKTPSALAPYVEAAVGVHFISPTFIYANRKFGSSFQFGDSVGFGVRLGDKRQYDLGYRYQHLSNGSIKQPNQGINLNEFRFTYRF
ncbi:MAG: acyloxyacyl hydrolase [Nitrosomonadales bacterium]|nr:acyloxyacyl hydrolase [Nitrosomonadales bacterium]